jgi:hypothetical protein
VLGSCGGAAVGATIGAGGAGAAAAAAAKGADKAALQKLQAAFDAKVEELAAAKDQLKESQVIAGIVHRRFHCNVSWCGESERSCLRPAG